MGNTGNSQHFWNSIFLGTENEITLSMLHAAASNGCHIDASERCGVEVGCQAEDGEVMGERIGEL